MEVIPNHRRGSSMNAERQAEAARERWWRWNALWPDPDRCELIWLLAHTALALESACLVGNPAPAVQRMKDRMLHPQVGDIVVEITSVWHTDWPERAIGRLHAISEDRLLGMEYDVESLYWVDHPITHWENARFIAIPIDEEKFLGKRGPVVFTKESLTAVLGDQGIEVKV